MGGTRINNWNMTETEHENKQMCTRTIRMGFFHYIGSTSIQSWLRIQTRMRKCIYTYTHKRTLSHATPFTLQNRLAVLTCCCLLLTPPLQRCVSMRRCTTSALKQQLGTKYCRNPAVESPIQITTMPPQLSQNNERRLAGLIK